MAAATLPMEAIGFPSGRAKKSFDVSQHPGFPPASAASGRLASQQ